MKKLTQTQELLRTLRSPMYTQKQKKIMQLKWRFNHMPESYKSLKKEEYIKEIERIEALDITAQEFQKKEFVLPTDPCVLCKSISWYRVLGDTACCGVCHPK